ncbi:MAG: thermonuclease family protein [Chitinophagaceae bacterium]
MKKLLIIGAILLAINISQACNRKNQQTPDPSAVSKTFNGKVVAIKDGDTFVILEDRNQITVRLSDIDCPEKKQPFGNKEKQFASELCFGKYVTVKRKSRNDRYGRMIAEVFLGDICVNKELVKNGLAWHFTKYSNDQSYYDLEQSARRNKLGLWNDKSPTPPWEWRVPKKANPGK